MPWSVLDDTLEARNRTYYGTRGGYIGHFNWYYRTWGYIVEVSRKGHWYCKCMKSRRILLFLAHDWSAGRFPYHHEVIEASLLPFDAVLDRFTASYGSVCNADVGAVFEGFVV